MNEPDGKRCGCWEYMALCKCRLPGKDNLCRCVPDCVCCSTYDSPHVDYH